MPTDISWLEVQHYCIVRLTQTWMLSRKLQQLLDEDIREQRSSLDELEQHDLLQEPDLMIEAEKEGIRTGADYEKLARLDPERVGRAYRQSHLRTERTRRRVDLELAENLFPSLTWSSLVLICMAQIEEALTVICNFLAREHAAAKHTTTCLTWHLIALFSHIRCQNTSNPNG